MNKGKTGKESVRGDFIINGNGVVRVVRVATHILQMIRLVEKITQSRQNGSEKRSEHRYRNDSQPAGRRFESLEIYEWRRRIERINVD